MLLRWIFLAAAVLLLAPPAGAQIDFLFPDGIASGDVTAGTAVLWTRRLPGVPVRAEVALDPSFAATVFAATALPGVERGGAVRVAATGLSPGTRYFYRFSLGGAFPSATGTFATAPPGDAGAHVRLAFSGDADGTRVGGRPVFAFTLLDAVAADRPDLFVFLGDTIYGDSLYAARRATRLEEYRAKYRESRAQMPLQRLLATVPVVAVWDDHEVENDFDRETVDPAKFAAGHQAFVEAWPITEQPGGRLYRSVRWGREVELFILDLRSYRTRQASKMAVCANPPGGRVPDLGPTLPPALRARFALVIRQFRRPVPPGCLDALRDPRRTLLGAAQKAWVKERLRQSDATWKLIVSQVPIQEFFALPYDRWEGYAAERAEILGYIREQKVRNVVWLSADTHAVLVNDVRLAASGALPEATGMKEVVAGPIATTPFAGEIARTLGAQAAAAFATFARTPSPRGPGMSCAVLDRFTYALVEVNARAGTVTITPKDVAGRPVCVPLVLTAVP